MDSLSNHLNNWQSYALSFIRNPEPTKKDDDLPLLDIEANVTDSEEREVPGTIKVLAKEISEFERAKMKEPPFPPGTAAGDASLFMPRQEFLLVKQYMTEHGTITTIGNVIYNILYKAEEADGVSSIIDIKTATDLGLISQGETVASKMDRTTTKVGSILHHLIIARPSANFDRALARQKIIRSFMQDLDLHQKAQKLLQDMAEGEISLLSCWDGKGQLPGAVSSMYYQMHPTINAIANNNSLILDASVGWTTTKKVVTAAMTAVSSAMLTSYACTEVMRSITGTGSPSLLEHYAIRFISSTSIGSTGGVLMALDVPVINAMIAAIGGITSGLCVQSNFEWLKADISMLPLMRGILSRVAMYYRGMKAMHALLSRYPEIAAKLEHFQKLDDFICNNNKIKELDQLFSLMESCTFNANNNYLFRPGEVLTAWELLHSGGGKKKKGQTGGEKTGSLAGDLIRSAFETALPAIGEIDTLLSAAKLMQESKDSTVKYCFPTLVQDGPKLSVRGAWNPMISADKAIPNNLALGEGAPSQNAVITGPNAGGKSSFAKAFGLVAALAPYGIVPAEEAELVLFEYIRTSMNISDSIENRQSLFAAQSALIGTIRKELKQLPEGIFSLTILDELFTQTNAQDGSALGTATAMEIGARKDNISMIVTHFKDLAKEVKEDRSGVYKNYRMENDGRYKLIEGISKDIDSNAFNIAESFGVDKAIIAKAKQLRLDRNDAANE